MSALTTWGRILIATGFICSSAPLSAEPVAAELARPAIGLKQPERAVLLDITAAGRRLVSVGERGVIIVSDDLGRSWHHVGSPVSATLTAVEFVDARSGWAVGHHGVVLHTTDGGDHWQLQLDGAAAAQMVLAAAQLEAFAPDKDPLQRQRQLKEAERLVQEGSDKPFFNLYFADDHTGWVVGAYGLCFYTSDAGATWQPWMQHLTNPDQLHLYAITGFGDVVYIAGEGGLFLTSSNGGLSFASSSTPYRGSFFTLTRTSDSQLVLAGMDGHAYRSEDSGKTWDALAELGTESWMASAAVHGGRALLANQSGQLVVSQPQTNALTLVGSAPGAPVAAVIQAGDGSLVTVGLHGVRRIAEPNIPEAAP